MNKRKKYEVFFFLVFSLPWLCSCGQKANSDCAKNIHEEIRPGASRGIAEAKLKECGFKTTYDHGRNILYGDKLKEGNPVAERTQAVVSLDSEGKVIDVRVSSGLIGP